MAKQIIGLVIILLLLGAAIFIWWQDQKDVIELNKGLPEGIKVTESLIGDEYKVVNKIDGYSFKVPEDWEGIGEIGYIPEREEKGLRGTSLNVVGLNEETIGVGIDRFQVAEDAVLHNWAQDMFNKVGLVGDFTSGKVENFETVRAQENIHLLGMYMYFLKNNNSVYTFTGQSEDFIREIIANGKW